MDDIKLHVDMNAAYYSIEASDNPTLRGKAVVVGGDEAARHGIVLAKSDLAKQTGIKTGNTLVDARRKCPGLIVVPPNFRLYLRVAREFRAILGDYSGRVEPFGIDECWVGLGRDTFEQGQKTADEIRRRVWDELGITASVGVAATKIMAKLGSDLKKPDATTVIRPEDYERMVWPLPASDLLMVGPSTAEKLLRAGITTIGGIAQASPHYLKSLLGVNGLMLYRFANGLDKDSVADTGYVRKEESVSHSITLPRDIKSVDEVRLTAWMLAEAVAERLRDGGFRARTVQLYVRDNALASFQRQAKVKRPTQLAHEIVPAAMQLFARNYDFGRQKPIRSMGIRMADLETVHGNVQLSFLMEDAKRIKQEQIEKAIDGIRDRFGHFAVQRACMLSDPIGRINPKGDHVIHPVSYL